MVDDAGRLLRAVLGRLGLGGGAELERKLAAARPGVDPVQFFGEKAVCALVGLGLCPLLAALGAEPFGPWPVWLWVALAGAGFAAPDAELERRLAARRARAVMELPVLLDMLAIGVSAGLALEQALERVARQAHGAVARELRQAVREMALGGLSVIEALEAMAERNAVPELTSVVGQLRAGHDQGLPADADAGGPGRGPARAQAPADRGGGRQGQRADGPAGGRVHPAGALRGAPLAGGGGADAAGRLSASGARGSSHGRQTEVATMTEMMKSMAGRLRAAAAGLRVAARRVSAASVAGWSPRSRASRWSSTPSWRP